MKLDTMLRIQQYMIVLNNPTDLVPSVALSNNSSSCDNTNSGFYMVSLRESFQVYSSSEKE